MEISRLTTPPSPLPHLNYNYNSNDNHRIIIIISSFSRTGHGHETNKDQLCVEILERELRRDPMSEAEERFRNRSC